MRLGTYRPSSLFLIQAEARDWPAAGASGGQPEVPRPQDRRRQRAGLQRLHPVTPHLLQDKVLVTWIIIYLEIDRSRIHLGCPIIVARSAVLILIN